MENPTLVPVPQGRVDQLDPARTSRPAPTEAFRTALRAAAAAALALCPLLAQPAAALINGRTIDPASNITVASATLTNGNFSVGVTTLAISNGNVAIGAASTSGRLGITNNSNSYNILSQANACSGLNCHYFLNTAANTASTLLVENSNVSNTGPVLSVVAAAGKAATFSGGNVGIGASVPATLLHLSSGVLLLDGTGVRVGINGIPTFARLEVTETVAGANTGFFFSDADSLGPLIRAGATSSEYAARLQSWNGGINIAYFRSDGNIGFGTESPQSLLHVQGSAQFGGVTASTFSATGVLSMAPASPIVASTWTATYASGSAFVCVNDTGTLWISEAACP